jgi:hypothetical protein
MTNFERATRLVLAVPPPAQGREDNGGEDFTNAAPNRSTWDGCTRIGD